MGMVGHLLIACEAELAALRRQPAAFYETDDDDDDDGDEIEVKPKAGHLHQVADLHAMSWLLSGETPGTEKAGPPRPAAFLIRGGQSKQLKARLLLGGGYVGLHRVRAFSTAECAAIAAELTTIGDDTIRRKGGEPSVADYRGLCVLMDTAAREKLLLLVAGRTCVLCSEKQLAKLAQGKTKPKRAKPRNIWRLREEDPTQHLDLDKLWEAMTQLLRAADTTGTCWELFTTAGRPLGKADDEGFGYGVARVLEPAEVATLAASIAAIDSVATTAAAGDGAYRVAPPDEYEALFRKMRSFFEGAARAGSGMIAYLD